MKYQIVNHDKFVIIFLSGEIDGNAAHAMRPVLIEEISHLHTPVVIDASGISGTERDVIFITGLMNGIRREVDFRKNRLLVGSLPLFIKSYLLRTGIDELFDICADTNTAISSIYAGGADEYRHFKTA